MELSDERPPGISDDDSAQADELAAPHSRVIYEVVRRQGEEELARPLNSLFWSGIAGGVTMMASVIAEAALQRKIPAGMPLRTVISELGYSVGFLVVILGRMQLFTEQTIVSALPVMARREWRKFRSVARLWAIVFLANMIGCCVAAAINVHVRLVSHELLAGMLDVAAPLLDRTPLDILLKGIPAGFLIASVAWVRAGVASGEFWIVLVLTYAIALGDFTHVVAGGSEAFLLVFDGRTGFGHAVGGIILPALVGNVIGGTGLFALLAHAQVAREI